MAKDDRDCGSFVNCRGCVLPRIAYDRCSWGGAAIYFPVVGELGCRFRDRILYMVKLIAALIVTGIVSYVHDGDTFWVDSYKVRLWGVDAAELHTARGQNQRRWVNRFLLGQSIICEKVGTSHDRIVARCALNKEDLGGILVENGWAGACPNYSGDLYTQLVKPGGLAYVSKAKFCKVRK